MGSVSKKAHKIVDDFAIPSASVLAMLLRISELDVIIDQVYIRQDHPGDEVIIEGPGGLNRNVDVLQLEPFQDGLQKFSVHSAFSARECHSATQ